ncbi:Protein kinase, putative [Hondaea fermentalgiana]|uniref:non-specific serine/threonine protein kinase n=1 Tax=Hondaea fermentalgiana TaxID=2315210 RepID=A0A2R5GSD4_9STRA|nr:Protein kinase, putative [Hondaea fermentalgiana]|eukprot:GBG33505.1 Protein kinase, putative [Hondaea fermentalgiana]
MDDIAACIKDHQYNEAIRKTVVDPEEALAKAILEKIPHPPKNSDALVPLEEYVGKVKLEDVSSCSIGRFLLCCLLSDQEPDTWGEKRSKQFEDAHDVLDEFMQSTAPSKTEATHVHARFSKLGKIFPKLGLDEAIATIATTINETDFTSEAPEALHEIFKPLAEIIREKVFVPAFELFKAHESYPTRFQELIWYRDREVCMDDFVVFRDLGRGAFGVVSGARHRVTGQMVALKGMNRKLIKGKKVLKMVVGEFQILKTLGEKPSPFCVSLVYSFMDSTDLYLGLPLCTGGDLMFHLRANAHGYGLERSRFFAAEILLALEHLHNLGILYRDLKPENVLLDEKGHTKISDMGLAVLTKRTPRTIGEKLLTGRAGTPGYWPPEMLTKKGYGFDADWWSYGVMLFEFLSGICCFSETYSGCKDRNEATLQYDIKFPELCGEDPFPEDAKDLILQLLERDRTKRLGANPKAVEILKAHPFFESMDWAQMAGAKVTPPWTPPADSINAASQEELQGRSKEHEFKKLKLTEEDDVKGINYSSKNHERDMVTVLRLERKGKLSHLEPSVTSGACNIL